MEKVNLLNLYDTLFEDKVEKKVFEILIENENDEIAFQKLLEFMESQK